MTLVLFLSALATSIHRSRRLCGCVLCCATAAPMEGLTLLECSHSLLPLNHRHLCFPGLAHILGVDCVDLLSSISHSLLCSNDISPIERYSFDTHLPCLDPRNRMLLLTPSSPQGNGY